MPRGATSLLCLSKFLLYSKGLPVSMQIESERGNIATLIESQSRNTSRARN